MVLRYWLLFFILISHFISGYGQYTGTIRDIATTEPLPFATIYNLDTENGVVADQDGSFNLSDPGQVVTAYTGYKSDTFYISEFFTDIGMEPQSMIMDAVVVSATKTFKRQTRTPVIVNIIGKETLDQVQACNLSDGLRFQPGLRVETDCQTCNYTQLRMNGLGGGYSQILINGRPIFSPLTGLYGMEQLPANMIDRIEVVRGGGSVLYGSGAIGGTVNVITRVPEENGFELGYTHSLIGSRTPTNLLAGNATIVNANHTAGATLFVNKQNRRAYDHNGDNFSELPALKNQAIGTNLFYLPNSSQKLEVSFSTLQEYRYGGEMVNLPPHLAAQSEERTHRVLLGNADYQVNFNRDNSSFISYLAGQQTLRQHYTGIQPDDPVALQIHLEDPPYGSSETTTFQGGMQLNHRIIGLAGISHVFTLGAEYVQDDVQDEIGAYSYLIDQFTHNLGMFTQTDWLITPSINVLAGVRLDYHNLVKKPVASPRISLLYRLRNTTQFRFTYGTGFRAPQAFDSDLHIAFAGGGVSRISLDPNLVQERSQSVSGSVNLDHAEEHWVAGLTAEGFYTRLSNAFYLEPAGEDQFGQRFVKRNGSGSRVQGFNLELRANYDQIVQVEAGFTLQTSRYDSAVNYAEELDSRREFLRTPNRYGYALLTLLPKGSWTSSLNLVYTGRMTLVHLSGSPEQSTNEFIQTDSFFDLNLKTGYTFSLPSTGHNLELFAGIRNMTNAYQNDFDTGKNRDSNYVYGPGLPRTIYMGIKLGQAGK